MLWQVLQVAIGAMGSRPTLRRHSATGAGKVRVRFSVLSLPFRLFLEEFFFLLALFASFWPVHERWGRWWPLAVGLGTRQDSPVKTN